MMDRLVQATDRTDTTWDEAIELAEATYKRVNWDTIRSRCMTKRTEDLGLHILPQVLNEVTAEIERTQQRDTKNPGRSLDNGL